MPVSANLPFNRGHSMNLKIAPKNDIERMRMAPIPREPHGLCEE